MRLIVYVYKYFIKKEVRQVLFIINKAVAQFCINLFNIYRKNFSFLGFTELATS
jgi:hypothetical protein